jgi:hypothetical protein
MFADSLVEPEGCRARQASNSPSQNPSIFTFLARQNPIVFPNVDPGAWGDCIEVNCSSTTAAPVIKQSLRCRHSQ